MRRPKPHTYPSIVGRDELEKARIRDAAATMAFVMSHWLRQQTLSNYPSSDALADSLLDTFMEYPTLASPEAQ